jgi:hypothetical protein
MTQHMRSLDIWPVLPFSTSIKQSLMHGRDAPCWFHRERNVIHLPLSNHWLLALLRLDRKRCNHGFSWHVLLLLRSGNDTVPSVHADRKRNLPIQIALVEDASPNPSNLLTCPTCRGIGGKHCIPLSDSFPHGSGALAQVKCLLFFSNCM